MENNFEVDRYPDGKTFLYINSARLEDCLDYYKNGDFYGVGINSMRGFALDNLSFLKKISDIDGLNYLTNLKYLLTNKISREFKDAVFKDLEELRIREKIKTLKRLAFVETEILDGDFSFFLDMPLVEYAGCIDKKHYSIKSDDLN